MKNVQSQKVLFMQESIPAAPSHAKPRGGRVGVFLMLFSMEKGLYQNKVNLSLTFTQRLGYYGTKLITVKWSIV